MLVSDLIRGYSISKENHTVNETGFQAHAAQASTDISGTNAAAFCMRDDLQKATGEDRQERVRMMNEMNMKDLEKVTGGSSAIPINWKRAVISSVDPAAGTINLYGSPEARPDNVLLKLNLNDDVYVNADQRSDLWIQTKVRNVITGYVEARYVSIKA